MTRGLKIDPVVQDIKNRYHFSGPTEVEDVKPQPKKNSFKLTGGSMEVGGDLIEIDLELYNDGLVATSKSNTEHTDTFLTDLISWLRQIWSWKSTLYRKPKRAYRSEVIAFAPRVKVANGLGKLSNLLSEIAKKGKVEREDLEPGRRRADPCSRSREGWAFLTPITSISQPLKCQHLSTSKVLPELEQMLADLEHWWWLPISTDYFFAL